jgi:hypothetical protein
MICFTVENKLVETFHVIRLLILVFYRNGAFLLQLMGFRIVVGTVFRKTNTVKENHYEQTFKIYHYENNLIRGCISCIQFHRL